MILVLIVGAVVALVLFPTFRCAVLHPFLLVWSGARDVFFYFKHKKYNLCPSGELVAYTGLFGRGKTLSAVHKVVSSYRRYEGKKVWCSRRQQLVTQRIKVISNVSLSIPYEDLVSLEQIVLAAERNQEYDNEHGTLTVTQVLGDEFSVQMNSRNFKTNIDLLFLNTILIFRHYYISLYYTAQRFGHVVCADIFAHRTFFCVPFQSGLYSRASRKLACLCSCKASRRTRQFRNPQPAPLPEPPQGNTACAGQLFRFSEYPAFSFRESPHTLWSFPILNTVPLLVCLYL